MPKGNPVSEGLEEIANNILRIDRLREQDEDYNTKKAFNSKKAIDEYLKSIVDMENDSRLMSIPENVYIVSYVKKIINDKDYPKQDIQDIAIKLATYSRDFEKLFPANGKITDEIKNYNANLIADPKILEVVNKFNFGNKPVSLPQPAQHGMDNEEILKGYVMDLEGNMNFAKETKEKLGKIGKHILSSGVVLDKKIQNVLKINIDIEFFVSGNIEKLEGNLDKIKTDFSNSLKALDEIKVPESLKDTVDDIRKTVAEAKAKLLDEAEAKGEKAFGSRHLSWEKTRN